MPGGANGDAALKHALAALIADAFELTSSKRPVSSADDGGDAAGTSHPPISTTTRRIDDDLTFAVQQVLDAGADADECAARLRLWRTQADPEERGGKSSVRETLRRIHVDTVRAARSEDLDADALARLPQELRDARGAARVLFDDAEGDDDMLDELLQAAELGYEEDDSDAAPFSNAPTPPPPPLLATPPKRVGDYAGRLLPVRPAPHPRRDTEEEALQAAAVPATATAAAAGVAHGGRDRRQPLELRRAGGQFLWRCDICGEENALADVVHAARRGRRRNDHFSADASGSGVVLVAPENEYLLRCRVCECRPNTY